jgi:translation initiation factor 1
VWKVTATRTTYRPGAIGLSLPPRPVAAWAAMGKPGKPPDAPPTTPFHRPFAGLAGKLGELPPGPDPVAAPAVAPAAPGPARAVVRMERAGRGGRTVTVVEKLGLPPAELETWCRALKQALGCGGAVEGDGLVLQGDVRDRVVDWLVKRGVRKVTR